MTKLYAKAFTGTMNFEKRRWWVGVGEEKDPGINEWLTPS